MMLIGDGSVEVGESAKLMNELCIIIRYGLGKPFSFVGRSEGRRADSGVARH